MEELQVLNKLAMARALKEFAVSLGISERFADILSQVHVHSSVILKNWPVFLKSNCLRCRNDPQHCAFFHPKKEECVGGATPGSTRQANIAVVELGKLHQCPCFEAG